MSMLSVQVDELRELATRYDELQVGAVKAVKMPSNMGSILRDAADTIWQLRDDLQRAHREKAKLRMFIDLKETCWKYVGWCDECPYNGVDDEHDDCNCTVREKVNSLARELGVEL